MTTPRLQLPELAQNQAQPHLTVNAALRLLDVLAQASAAAIQNAPPGSPEDGDVYIVGTSPTGDWAGQANRIAAYIGTAWAFVPPRNGFYFYVVATSSFWRYNSGWFEDESGGGLTDAPSDSQTYGRRNGEWVTVEGGGGGLNLADGAAFNEDFTDLDRWLTEVSGSGAAVTLVSPEDTQAVGVVRLETGTASNGRAGIYFGTSQAVALAQLNGFATGGRPTRVRFRIRCLDNPRATEDFVLRLGFASNPLQAGGPSAGDAVMAYIDTEWRVVAPGTATINTDSWGDEVTGGWSWIEFYSDAENPNESTVSLQGQTNPIATYELDETASIPGSIFVQVEKLSGGSNRRVEVDYASLRVEFVR